MTKFPSAYIEDKALRDSARGVFRADLEHAKHALSGKALANRMGSRIGEGAKDVAEIAKVHAGDHRSALAILLGAIVLWFARNPILEIFGLGSEDETAESVEDSSADDAEVLGDETMNEEQSTEDELLSGDDNA